jgi:Bacterial Ig domain
MHRIEVAPHYFVDQIGTVSSPVIDKEISVNSSGPLIVGGWAADSSGVAASGVEVTIDQKPYFTTYGVERPDVAVYLKDPTYNKFGFQFRTPASQFSNGTHDLTVRIINKDRTGYFETPVYHLRVQ